MAEQINKALMQLEKVIQQNVSASEEMASITEQLNLDKKLMVELRIKPRLRVLNMVSYREYCEYLFGQSGFAQELSHLIDAVTTNKTDFFREPGHFEYLVQKALPDLMSRSEGGREIRIWSAGCSTGEEPYTLAILLSGYSASHPGFRFSLLATDIAQSVLEKATLGIFNADVVDAVPLNSGGSTSCAAATRTLNKCG